MTFVTALDDLHALLDDLRHGSDRLPLGGLSGASMAYVAGEIARVLDRPLFILCANVEAALDLSNDLGFFLSGAMPVSEDDAGDAPASRLGAPLFFPPYEVTPYDGITPDREVTGQRLRVLSSLLEDPRRTIVSTMGAAMQRVLPGRALASACLQLEVGASFDLEELAARLTLGGYRRELQVEAHGDFGIRGGILDVFPAGADNPVRCEFVGNEIESLRVFDLGTQKSSHAIDRVSVQPAQEALYTPGDCRKVIERLRQAAVEQQCSEPTVERLVELLREGSPEFPAESLLPLLYGGLETIWHYLDPECLQVLCEPEMLEAEAQRRWETLEAKYSAAQDGDALALKPSQFALSPSELPGIIGQCQRLEITELAGAEGAARLQGVARSLSLTSFRGHFSSFIDQLHVWLKDGYRIVIVCASHPAAERLQALLLEHDLGAHIVPEFSDLNLDGPWRPSEPDAIIFKPEISLCIGRVSSGFQSPPLRLILFSESQIFGLRQRRQYKAKSATALLRTGLKEMHPGDFVVHHEHGIGRYAGLSTLTAAGSSREFVEIEYSGGEKLYVPVDQIALLDRYIGAGAPVRLDKLGGVSWKRVKARIKRSVQHMARALLRLSAVREVVEGAAASQDEALHHEFAAAFEYEETEDQARAIEEVRSDMERRRPMDRLICGDVGYGKTEVAMRAAFKAVYDKSQVVVLVPTTILAQQHFLTFQQRFAGWPVNIEMLCRLVPRPRQQQIVQNLAEGKVDIVIGTHRLLQRDVAPPNLGLLVIDEEHRFGVSHKEKIKRLRSVVDVLSLSATPIPRTMQLALLQVRDLSVINTPPEDRLPVHTYVVKFNTRVIREAIINELQRGGQVFFVHNRVESIATMAAVVKSAVPEATIGVAHGQMSERALERAMLRFLAGEFSVLVCTTIIESGLDIPNANTIIMNRADKLGLAQLYQLRGRVGRDRYQAYAYLLVPGLDALSDVSRKRLRTIEELSGLSSGFQLASRDLEIRGAGNILGPEQSGHITALGFDMYCRLLEDAVAELKGQKPSDIFEPMLSLGFYGAIPADYVRHAAERLELYHRISLCDDEREIEEIADELLDRYGGVPDEVEQLIAVNVVRIRAQRLRIERLERAKSALDLQFHPTTTLSPERLVIFLTAHQQTASLVSDQVIRLSLETTGWRETYTAICNHLRALAEA